MDKPQEQEGLSRQPFRIADWEIEPATGHIHRGEEDIKLEPRVMDLLICLASRPGEVFSREELETIVWTGMVVGYDALTSAMIKLRKAFNDDPHHPQIIETISKQGYRLIAPVGEVLKAPPATREPIPRDDLPQRTKFHIPKLTWIAAIVIAGILAGGLGYWLTVQYRTSSTDTVAIGEEQSDKPAIAVLPFTNMSDDPEQEYFVDGITEDLITEFSRLSNLTVIAWTTSSSYKGKMIQPQNIGNDLGVDYILNGSVRKSGDRLRITAQLVETRSSKQFWAERYDRKLIQVFELQDEVTNKIVNALSVRITTAEKEKLGRADTNNIAAYDSLLRGLKYFKQRTREGNELAREAYRHAIELDPTYARPYGALAVSLSHAYRRGYIELSAEEAYSRALELAQKAVALDQSSPQVYWALGYVYLFQKQYEEAAAATKQAVTLAPNYADGYGLLAFINNWQGNAEDAIRYIRKAMVLNPHYPFDYPWNLGLANYTLGQYTEAVEALEDALTRNENALLPRLYLSASYVRLGRQDDAEWEIEQTMVQFPRASVLFLIETLPYEKRELMNMLLKDLRQAGLPE